jgi:hypothetical protein
MSNPPPPPPGYPPYGSPAPVGPKPDNYLVWAILSTLFCCLPLGIVSIVFSAQVDGKYNSGDYAGAVESSSKAKKFATWSAISSVIIVVLLILLSVGLAAGSSN